MERPVPSLSSRRGDGPLAAYLKAIRAHPLIVLGIALLGLGTAAALLSRKQDTYVSTAQVLVTPLAGDAGAFAGLPLLRESSDPTRVTQTAAELLDSAQAAAATAQRVGSNLSREDVQGAIEVQPQGQSSIVAVTARSSSARLSARLANTFVSSALELRRVALSAQVRDRIGDLDASASPEESAQLRQLQAIIRSGDPTMSLSQIALAPRSPIGAPAWLVLLLAAVVGTTIGCGAAVLLHTSDERLHDPLDVLDTYPLPVLAQIPHHERPWYRRQRTGLAVPSGVLEAYRTLQLQIQQSPKEARVVTVVSPNEGDGKTTSAIQLALGLVASGHSVILIDLDLRRPQIARRLSLPAGTTGLLSMLADQRRLVDVLVSFPHEPRLRIVPGEDEESNILPLSDLTERLPEMLLEAQTLAEYVIVDTAPLGEVSDALRVVPYTDAVIIVARLGNTQRPDLERVRDLLDRATVDPLGLVLVGVRGVRGSSYAYGYKSRSEPTRRLPAAVRAGRQ